MKLKVLLLVSFLLLTGTTYAQDFYRIYRLEITPVLGYNLSTSVKIDETRINSGGEYDGYYLNELDVKSGPSYGFIADVSATENFQLEFIWTRTNSALSGYIRPTPGAGSREKVDIFDMNVDNFHFNLLFQEEMMDEKVWPFFFGGIGGTRFGPKEDYGSDTKFSINLGAGVKAFFHDHVGVRFQGRWIPIFIQSGEAIWCDWYGWCWAVPTGDYLHQFEFTGGVVFRF